MMRKLTRSGAVIGFSLCGLCCAAPLLGAVAGMGALASFAASLEKIAVGLLGVTALILLWSAVQSRRQGKCNVDCDCRPDAIDSGR